MIAADLATYFPIYPIVVRSSFVGFGDPAAVVSPTLPFKGKKMSANNESRLTPRDVARVLFRHWRKIAFLFFSMFGLTLLAIAVLPRSYASEAKLFIRVGRESVALDPTATTGQTIMVQKTVQDEVNSAVSVLTSQAVLKRVAERVGAGRILRDEPPATSKPSAVGSKADQIKSWIGEKLVSLGFSDPGTEMDRVVRQLEQKTKVTPPRQTMVISVQYTAASPQLAHDVVDALTAVFLEENSRLSQTEGSLAFFEHQVDELFNELTAAQTTLRERKNAYKLTTSGGRRSIVESSTEAMRQRVYELEQLEKTLMVKYTDDYPPLKEIRRQRKLAEDILVGTVSGETRRQQANGVDHPDAGGTSAKSPVSTASFLASAPASDQHNERQAELQALNKQEFELAQLEREVQLLEGKYVMHVQKLEEARINDALGRERISNVKVAQPATLVSKPVSPKKPLILIGGVLLATVGSLYSAFLAESVDQTLRTSEQVESQLGLPVLATLPYRKRRRRRWKLWSSRKRVSAANTAESDVKLRDRSAYRGLLASFLSSRGRGNGHAKMIGVVGCSASAMRSRVAAGLATVAAADNKFGALLIDADARRRRIAKFFRVNGSPGWREMLDGSAALNTCVQQAGSGGLAVMGPGNFNDRLSSAVKAADEMTIVEQIKNDYGLVVVDLPRGFEHSVPEAAAEMIDEAVLVVNAEHTRIQAAQRAKDMLTRAGVSVAGVVLANRRDYIPGWLYRRL